MIGKLHGRVFSLLLILQISITANAQNSLQVFPAADIKTADSLYIAGNWKLAKQVYETILKDSTRNSVAWNRLGFSNYHLGLYDAALKYYQKSLSQNHSPALKPVVYSRMARIHALKKEEEKAIADLDSAVNAGYANIAELDSLTDFNNLRNKDRFKEIRQQVYAAASPCMVDAHAREFDFWIGEWDVYQTGTKNYAGHSLVQMIAGGCALLENWDSPASNGKSINYIDPVSNKWKQAWAGSYAGGIQEFLNGEYKDSAMQFVFETTDAQHNKVTGRFIFFNQGPDQVRQFSETSADNGKTWITNYDFTYFRKK